MKQVNPANVLGRFKNLKDAFQGKAEIGKLRSSKWPEVRASHLKRNPKCAVCGGSAKLEVHHIIPFHINPDLELVPTNLVTLCESGRGGLVCHLAIGHMGNYRLRNNSCVRDAAYLRERFTALGVNR